MDRRNSHSDTHLRRFQRLLWIPHVINAIVLLLALALFFYASRAIHGRDIARFENRTRLITESIQGKLEAYLLALRGGKGVLESSPHFDSRVFHAYVEALGLERHLPGIQGIGYTERTTAGEKSDFMKRIRANTPHRDFKIWPEHEREEYHSIIYLHPMDRRNTAAIGYDMFTEPVRRAAMVRAAETGEPSATGKVTLVQEIDKNKQPGFLIYVPVYQGGAAPGTAEERRRMLQGYVYSPFRIYDLFSSIFDKEAFSYVNFTLEDVTEPGAPAELYRTPFFEDKNEGELLTKEAAISVPGRKWMIRFHAAMSGEDFLPWFAAMSSALFVFLFIVTFLLGRTQRRLARKAAALTQAEERFRLVVEADPNGLITLDESGRILLANRSMGKLFGYGKSEFTGKNVTEFLELDYGKALRSVVPAAPGETPVFITETRAKRRDGTFFHAELLLNPIYPGSGSLCLAVILDITGKKESEEEIKRQNEKLEKSNRELEQFAYVASHDLQEPLRTVSSFAELLKLHFEGSEDAQVSEYLRFIEDGAVRAQRLIRELLQYAHIGSQGKPFETVRLSEIVRKTLEDLDAAVKESGAVIETAPLPAVHADGFQMRQLFQNLLQNAIKYRDKKRALKIEILCEERTYAWIIGVRDNGIGISGEYHEKIFKIFQRLHTRDDRPGTGIGLAVCKRIVERHAGDIWVDSKPGSGSIFYVSIPKNSPVSQGGEYAASDSLAVPHSRS